jgi:hypothetical protein
LIRKNKYASPVTDDAYLLIRVTGRQNQRLPATFIFSGEQFGISAQSSTTWKHFDNEYDERQNQQQMNRISAEVGNETEQPESQQNH